MGTTRKRAHCECMTRTPCDRPCAGLCTDVRLRRRRHRPPAPTDRQGDGRRADRSTSRTRCRRRSCGRGRSARRSTRTVAARRVADDDHPQRRDRPGAGPRVRPRLVREQPPVSSRSTRGPARTRGGAGGADAGVGRVSVDHRTWCCARWWRPELRDVAAELGVPVGTVEEPGVPRAAQLREALNTAA